MLFFCLNGNFHRLFNQRVLRLFEGDLVRAVSIGEDDLSVNSRIAIAEKPRQLIRIQLAGINRSPFAVLIGKLVNLSVGISKLGDVAVCVFFDICPVRFRLFKDTGYAQIAALGIFDIAGGLVGDGTGLIFAVLFSFLGRYGQRGFYAPVDGIAGDGDNGRRVAIDLRITSVLVLYIPVQQLCDIFVAQFAFQNFSACKRILTIAVIGNVIFLTVFIFDLAVGDFVEITASKSALMSVLFSFTSSLEAVHRQSRLYPRSSFPWYRG